MIIYKDLITGTYYRMSFCHVPLTLLNATYVLNWIFILGDEMFTDSSKVKLIDDCIFEVECRVSLINRRKQLSVNI